MRGVTHKSRYRITKTITLTQSNSSAIHGLIIDNNIIYYGLITESIAVPAEATLGRRNMLHHVPHNKMR